tara:strand:+ start:2911 stop:4173 length:1263 start_codon:yes stop_codon:yes gene_type:complete
MKVAVIGLWHLGTVISAGLSSLKKNKIYCFDEKKIIENFKKNKLPITEKNIKILIKKNHEKNIFFYSDFKKLKEFNVIWIAYDANIDKRDFSNFNDTFKKFKKILNYIKRETLVIISTQIPIGSIKKLEIYDKIKIKKKLRFAYIPENLRLGKSLEIFLNSKDIIIGLRNLSDKNLVSKVLEGINSRKNFVGIETAEMTKHVINTYLACSIALINEISMIASKHNVSFKDLEQSVKTDKRISSKAYLRPGNPFSGGTLARDINYLITQSKKNSFNNILLKSILKSNYNHSKWVEKIINIQKNLKSKKILQIGLSYTSGTTTLRRSLPMEIFNKLRKNFQIKVFDEFLRKNSSEIEKIKQYFEFNSKNKKFDIIIIFNNNYNFKIIKKFIKKNSLIIDINNFYKKDCLKNNIKYKSLEYDN